MYLLIIRIVTFQIFQQDPKNHYRTLTKTRTFVVDGQVVKNTTSKVVVSGEENKSREEHELW